MKIRKLYIIGLLVLFHFNLYAEDELFLSIGEQKSVIFEDRIKKVAIGHPNIADIRTLSHYEVLITAKNQGETSFITWTKTGKVVKKIVVSRVDMEKMIKEIKNKLKNTKGIKATVKDGKVVLEGEIKNNNEAAIVESILIKYPNIRNLVALPVQMIKIEARLVEMGTSDSSTIGINWRRKFEFVESKIEGVAQLGELNRTTKIDAVLDFLAQEGRAKIVARPNIIVINGKTASFHSGGTLLIPMITAEQSSVDEKSYGVDLKILPYGDREANLIKTQVDIEVSTIDYQNAVKTEDATYPALKDRRISTEIDVKVGKTIVIAGLLMEEEQVIENKVPILGSIPLLGYLFSSKDTIKKKTELVIFLTPSFVNFMGEEIIE